MKLNANRDTPSKQAASLIRNLAKRLEEEVTTNPMVSDEVLYTIIEEAVTDKIELVQIIGRKDGSKEVLMRELRSVSKMLKDEVRNRFRKKGATLVDLTSVEVER